MYVQTGFGFVDFLGLVITLFVMGYVTYAAVKKAIKDALGELGITRNNWQRTVDRMRSQGDEPRL